MKKTFFCCVILVIFFSFSGKSQVTLTGKVFVKGVPIAYATVFIKELNKGTTTNNLGEFKLLVNQTGLFTIQIHSIEAAMFEKKITVSTNSNQNLGSLHLQPSSYKLRETVVTATRSQKSYYESPIAVQVLTPKSLEQTQSINTAAALNFQPGLRVETDCQTCNYTQLRMNGLLGSYSQILINSRPIFTSLMGLYGLEQIPENMIERIEVVKGASSVLYGSSAIGGSVNIITKMPHEKGFTLNHTFSKIGNKASDNYTSGNLIVTNNQKTSGYALNFSTRNRISYDHNNDGFTEIPKINSFNYGLQSHHHLGKKAALETSVMAINENRKGGNNILLPAHFTNQGEEREHQIIIGSINYQVNIKKTQFFQSYISGQNTNRTHYTGFGGFEGYGKSKNYSIQAGSQFQQTVSNFILGKNIFTIGTDFLFDDVFDEIKAYNYLINQSTQEIAGFLQSDWEIGKLEILSGVRVTKHNLVAHAILIPRLNLKYNLTKALTLRLGTGKGYRAPQAFDSDMHIAFAGGGISRIQLHQNLKPEISTSISGGIFYHTISNRMLFDFSIEAFYNKIDKVFILEEILNTNINQQILEKRNGNLAVVNGLTCSSLLNLNKKIEVEFSVTAQKSLYQKPVAWSGELTPQKNFLRTPNIYGYYILNYYLNSKLEISLSSVFTGKMLVPHYAGSPETPKDILIESPHFFDQSVKVTYHKLFMKYGIKCQFYGGLKNVFNQYQSDFDSGPNRDSNFIYGPAAPFSPYIGLKLTTL